MPHRVSHESTDVAVQKLPPPSQADMTIVVRHPVSATSTTVLAPCRTGSLRRRSVFADGRTGGRSAPVKHQAGAPHTVKHLLDLRCQVSPDFYKDGRGQNCKRHVGV